MEWPLLDADQPTPSLIVSAEIARQNIAAMQQYCDLHRLRLRPHTKTHKSIAMAKWQIEAGAAGLTVAKVGEAEKMSGASKDLLLAYPAIGPARVKRLVALARDNAVQVAVDSEAAMEILQSAAREAGVRLGILVDVDVGFHRTGIVDPSAAIALCQHVSHQSHLTFEGLMCFPGHIVPDSSNDLWSNYEQSLGGIIDSLHRSGIEAKTISGGSTPTANQSHRNKFLNEIRPGTYIYNDWNEVRLGVCQIEQCAGRVLATVVSVPERNKFIVDAGSKTLSSDRNARDPDSGFGYVVEYPTAKIGRLSEEHGEVIIPSDQQEQYKPPRVGDRVWIIPNHICVCVNLQSEFYLLEHGKLTLMPVDARGQLI